MGSRMAAKAVAAIGVVAIAGTALAGHQTSDVKSTPAASSAGDGVIAEIKEGHDPDPSARAGMEAHFSGGAITAISAQRVVG